MSWTEDIPDLVDQAGYLACGCHGSLTEHVCPDLRLDNLRDPEPAPPAPWWDR
jgi:hypothetical protein